MDAGKMNPKVGQRYRAIFDNPKMTNNCDLIIEIFSSDSGWFHTSIISILRTQDEYDVLGCKRSFFKTEFFNDNPLGSWRFKYLPGQDKVCN
jgi:hypothetical protein